MHSPCLQFIWHTLIAKRIFRRYCFHLFPPLYQHFQWALPVSSNLKSLLPAIEHPEIHPHPHASISWPCTAPPGQVPSRHPSEPVLCRSDPVFLLLSFHCLGWEPLHVLQTLADRKCIRQDELLARSQDQKTKPASVANKGAPPPRKKSSAMHRNWISAMNTDGQEEEWEAWWTVLTPMLQFQGNKPEPTSRTLGINSELMKSLKRFLFSSDECSLTHSEASLTFPMGKVTQGSKIRT